MANTTKEYTLKDMKEIDISLAPGVDLPPFEVKKFFMPKDGEKVMLLYIDTPESWKPASCPYCGSTKINLDGRSKKRIVRDITRNNYCVFLYMEPRRFKCSNKDCMQRVPVELPGFKRKATVTDRVIEFIQKEAFYQNFEILAERTGLTSVTVANYFDEKVEELEADRKANPPEAPLVLGIDEKHNEHKAMGVFVDVINSRLIEVTPDNKKETMIAAIKSFSNWDKNIKVVTTDMAGNYHSWLPSLFPNDVKLVVDKFHVIQGLNQAINAGRPALYDYLKAQVKGISDPVKREEKMAVLRLLGNDIRLLNYSFDTLKKNPKKATELTKLTSTFPEIDLFKKMESYLEKMYTMKTRADAEKVWNEWQAILPPENIKRKDKEFNEWCKKNNVPKTAFAPFRKFSSSQGYPKYKDAILNYFIPGCGYTNAATEAFNSVIRQINARGNGYGFIRLRALAVYAPTVYSRVTYSIDINDKICWASVNNPDKIVRYSKLAEALGNITKIKTTIYKFKTEEIKSDNPYSFSFGSAASGRPKPPKAKAKIEGSDIIISVKK